MREVTRELVSIDGPRGRLAGELAYPHDDVVRGGVLLLNPHPLMGGRRDNPLVRAVAEEMTARGLATLRFDYGGVGDSEGPRADVASSMNIFWETGAAPEDPVMVEEAGAALRWLQERAWGPFAIVGYSFGAFVATLLADTRIASVGLLAPTIDKHDFSALCGWRGDVLIVHGEDDFAADPQRLAGWTTSLSRPVTTYRVDGGAHFFRGREAEIAGRCAEHVAGALDAADDHDEGDA